MHSMLYTLVAILFGGTAAYFGPRHTRVQTLSRILARPAESPAQRVARWTLGVGGVVLLAGFILIPQPWPWVRTSAGRFLMAACLIAGGVMAAVGAFAIGYTAEPDTPGRKARHEHRSPPPNDR